MIIDHYHYETVICALHKRTMTIASSTSAEQY